MTTGEQFWLRVNRYVARLTPDVETALITAFAVLRARLSDAEIAQAIESGAIEKFIDAVLSDRIVGTALLLYRTRVRRITERGVTYFARDLPAAGKIDGTLSISFDVLNPRVLDAISALDTKVISNLADGIRETVREAVRRGLVAGENPRTIALGLRDVIGLAPNQLQEVENFRAALEGRDGRNPLTYTLRNRRYDQLFKDGRLTPEQIDRAVESYRKARIAQNATTNATTATLDAFRQGQQLSWQDAIDKGLVNGDLLLKQWVQVQRPTKREEHIPLNGEIVPFSEPYSNGQMIPGEDDYNCACGSRVFEARDQAQFDQLIAA